MIELAYFERSDFEQLINWIDSEELMVNWSGALFSYPLTMRSMEWYLRDVNDPATSDAFVYKAIETDTGETVGHISLGGISHKNRAGRITRVFVAPGEHRGKGYCRQMVTAILKIGFEQLKLHRISLGVYDFNKSAIQCYQKAGMKIEGTSRDCLRYDGEWWSLVEMSMLETEWREIT